LELLIIKQKYNREWEFCYEENMTPQVQFGDGIVGKVPTLLPG